MRRPDHDRVGGRDRGAVSRKLERAAADRAVRVDPFDHETAAAGYVDEAQIADGQPIDRNLRRLAGLRSVRVRAHRELRRVHLDERERHRASQERPQVRPHVQALRPEAVAGRLDHDVAQIRAQPCGYHVESPDPALRAKGALQLALGEASQRVLREDPETRAPQSAGRANRRSPRPHGGGIVSGPAGKARHPRCVTSPGRTRGSDSTPAVLAAAPAREHANGTKRHDDLAHSLRELSGRRAAVDGRTAMLQEREQAVCRKRRSAGVGRTFYIFRLCNGCQASQLGRPAADRGLGQHARPEVLGGIGANQIAVIACNGKLPRTRGRSGENP